MAILEIIVLLGACKIIGDKVRERGRRALGFQVMFIALCVAGDLAGVLLATAAGVREVIQIYLWGLFGVSWGAAIGLKIVSTLSDLTQPLDYTSREFPFAPNSPPSDGPIDPSNPYAAPQDFVPPAASVDPNHIG